MQLQGLHQGAPWSMDLFEVLKNDLLVELKLCNVGSSINKVRTTSPAYADDVTLAALSKNDLEVLITKCYNYSIKWRFEYNVSKCAVVIFGKDKCKSMKIKLGNTEIKESSNEPHLRIVLAPDDRVTRDYVNSRIQ